MIVYPGTDLSAEHTPTGVQCAGVSLFIVAETQLAEDSQWCRGAVRHGEEFWEPSARLPHLGSLLRETLHGPVEERGLDWATGTSMESRLAIGRLLVRSRLLLTKCRSVLEQDTEPRTAPDAQVCNSDSSLCHR